MTITDGLNIVYINVSIRLWLLQIVPPIHLAIFKKFALYELMLIVNACDIYLQNGGVPFNFVCQMQAICHATDFFDLLSYVHHVHICFNQLN